MSKDKSPARVKHTPLPAAESEAQSRAADLDYSFPPDDPAAMPLEPEESAAEAETADEQALAAAESSAVPATQASGGGGGGAVAVPNETEEADDDDDGDDEEEDEEEGEVRPAQSIFEHFRELRSRLIRIAFAIVAGFGICWFFHNQLADIVYLPLINALPEGAEKSSSIIFTGVAEGFLTHMKLAIVAGIFVMSPFIFYQVWAFIAPGLYREEKRFIVPVAISSALCFIAGGLFCYFVVFPNAFRFFMTYSDGAFQAMPSMKEYFGFTIQLMLAFGLIFEMPLFCFFLAKMGIVKASAMRRFRRYFIVIAFILGAFLTPPDPLSQMLMAGPLLILYELSILIAAAAGKKKEAAEEDDDDEDDEDEDEEDEGGEENDEDAEEDDTAASPA